MNRARPVETALAALATLMITLPLIDLFAPASAWARPSVALVVLVGLVGAGLRSVVAQRPVVVLVQALVLLEALALLHGRGHLWRGVVPTLDTVGAVGILLGDAYTTITSYSAQPASGLRVASQRPWRTAPGEGWIATSEALRVLRS